MIKIKKIYRAWLFFFSKRALSDVEYLIQISTNSNKKDYILNNEINIKNLFVLIKNSIKWIFINNVYYATHYKNFLGLSIFVNKYVLVPRFETELLVTETIKLIKEHQIPTNIIDIGTGSGVIAIYLKKQINTANVTAIDISKKILKVASKNALINNVNVNFKQKDLYNYKSEHNVIISNPPYLYDQRQVEKNVLNTEPHLALFASNKGLSCYEAILKNYQNNKSRPLLFAFEIGENQQHKIKKIAIKYYKKPKVFVKKDFNNIERFIFILIK